MSAISKQRLIVLDHLRGYFIVVIIIDHLSRWPSIWGLFTGKAFLWVTAAEGFVAISGLLVGYVRGYKNRHESMRSVSGKLIRRALLLYLWSVIATVVYTAIIWYIPLQGGTPSSPVPQGDWMQMIFKAATLQYTNVWVHFLGLYALFLAAAPLAVWLLRKGKAWLVGLLSLVILAAGWILHNEPMQWQFLFFIPAIAGYYLETILDWWRKLSKKRRHTLAAATVSTTLATIGLSVVTTFYPESLPILSAQLNALFGKETISLWRAGMAFLWFTGFIFIFWYFHKQISKYLGWLLTPIGTHSLTAYILHGLSLCIISALTISGSNLLINSLLGAVAVLIVWSMLKIPHINRVIPR